MVEKRVLGVTERFRRGIFPGLPDKGNLAGHAVAVSVFRGSTVVLAVVRARSCSAAIEAQLVVAGELRGTHAG